MRPRMLSLFALTLLSSTYALSPPIQLAPTDPLLPSLVNGSSLNNLTSTLAEAPITYPEAACKYYEPPYRGNRYDVQACDRAIYNLYAEGHRLPHGTTMKRRWTGHSGQVSRTWEGVSPSNPNSKCMISLVGSGPRGYIVGGWFSYEDIVKSADAVYKECIKTWDRQHGRQWGIAPVPMASPLDTHMHIRVTNRPIVAS